MKTVRTVIIPAAGVATRFLPASKAVPKEMFPLVDKPLLQYALEEAAAAGLTRAVLITSAGKRAMEDHFDRMEALEGHLQRRGDAARLRKVREPEELLQLSFVRQREPLGLGHAVLQAALWVDDEPAAVMLPDDLIVSDVPVLAQMLEVYREHGASVIAVERLPREELAGYGVVAVTPVAERLYRVEGLVEKPRPEEAPSDLGIVGRYILTPGIFAALRETPPGALGEVQLTDGLARLLEREPIYAYAYAGERYDAGTPLGFLYAAVAMALRRPEYAEELRRRLRALLQG
jgi:UTP--glucose-1-phosphate uridylyltransferase